MKGHYELLLLLAVIMGLTGCGKVERYISTHYRNGGIRIVLSAANDKVTDAEVNEVMRIIEMRMKYMGVTFNKRMISHEGNKFTVLLPYARDIETIKKIFLSNPDFSIRSILSDWRVLQKAMNGQVPEGFDLMKDREGKFFLVNQKPEVLGTDVAWVKSVIDKDGRSVLQIKLRKNCKKRFFEFTQNNFGGEMAVVVNGKMRTALEIREPIRGGHIEIFGQFSQKEYEALDILTKSGYFPISMKIESIGKVYE